VNKKNEKMNIINKMLLAGYGAVFIIGMIIISIVPGAVNAYEGILSKLSILPSFAFAYFAFKNRLNYNNERE